MKKPLQPHLLKRVPTACKGERTMKWRGRPPIGGQDSDRVSHRCFAPYTLLPLRGISPQGGTRNLRRKTGESYASCTTPAFPLWWLAPPPFRPAGKRVTGFSVAYGSLRIQFPCHRKRGHYKAPLCCELLMKGLLCGSLLSHRSAGGRWCRKAPKGGEPPEVADRRNAFHAI